LGIGRGGVLGISKDESLGKRSRELQAQDFAAQFTILSLERIDYLVLEPG
jgi:hypothetical protein